MLKGRFFLLHNFTSGLRIKLPNLFLDECIGEIIELSLRQPRPAIDLSLTKRAESQSISSLAYIMERPITEVVSLFSVGAGQDVDLRW